MLARQAVVAVLPMHVTITPPRRSEYDVELLDRLAEDEGYAMQSELYSRFLRQVSRDNYTVGIQDVYETNRLLTQAGVSYQTMSEHSIVELSELLGVDAVIAGHIRRQQPVGQGAAVALAMFGIGANTNEVTVDLTIHDSQDGTLMWRYNHEVAGDLGSSPERLAETLMRKISRRIPYRD
jgi:hypothetical protein